MKRFYWVLTILGLMLMLSVTVTQADGTICQNTCLRVVHASPDAGAVDIYIDGNPQFTNTNFSQIQNYREVTPGNHNIRILPAGSNPNTPPIIEANLPFGDKKHYTLIVVGKLAQLELLQMEDNNGATPQNKARVRFTHAASDLPGVDICVVGQNNCFLTNLAYKGSATADVDIGTYNIDVRIFGSNDIVLNIPNSNFRDGYSYSCYIVGLLNGAPRIQPICALYPTRGEAVQPLPTPIYPPVNGAMLAPELQIALLGLVLIIGFGVWIFRSKVNSV